MEKLNLHDPETKSADIVAENVVALGAQFPDAFHEGRIDFDVLKQLLGGAVVESEERYGLNWHGKRQARQIALTSSTGTLLPRPEDSVDWDGTRNLMIEGDNLEVLKILQKSYARKVKLIYIDPPYNTGNDFVFPDDYRDGIQNYYALTGQIDDEGKKTTSNTERSGRFHTNWLNMMLPRLKLAKSLLRKDGVILISIDDQEFPNLRILCDEIFGPENFIAAFVWEKSRKNDARLVSVGHEYAVVYASSLGFLNEMKVRWREEKPGAREIWQHYLSLRERHGSDDAAVESSLQRWFSELPRSHPSRKWSRYKNVDKHGPWRDYDISWPGGGGPRYDVIHPETGLPCAVPERGWIFPHPETMQRMIDIGAVEFRKDHTEPPIRKSHLRPIDLEIASRTEDDENADFDSEIEASAEVELATQVRGSYFYKQSQVTAKFMRSLMGNKVFDNPKDHEELSMLLEYATSSDPDAVFMDFFAGSGTTGHSVWELNAKDDGNRRFVLVQLPQPLDPEKKDQKAAAEFCAKMEKPLNLAELAKERLRRAAKKIRADNPSYSGDLGFRVYKLAESNIRAWNPNSLNLEGTLLEHAEHLLPGRSEADILTELLLKLGLDLCVAIEMREIAGKAVYSVGGGALIVCLADDIDRDTVEELANGIISWQKVTITPPPPPIPIRTR